MTVTAVNESMMGTKQAIMRDDELNNSDVWLGQRGSDESSDGLSCVSYDQFMGARVIVTSVGDEDSEVMLNNDLMGLLNDVFYDVCVIEHEDLPFASCECSDTGDRLVDGKTLKIRLAGPDMTVIEVEVCGDDIMETVLRKVINAAEGFRSEKTDAISCSSDELNYDLMDVSCEDGAFFRQVAGMIALCLGDLS